MNETTPQAWAREAWSESRIELLVPVAIGLAAAYFLTVAFALHSSHHLLLLVCLAGVGFAVLRSFAFLYRLSRDHREELITRLTMRDILGVFIPFAASLALYAAIAPNYRLSVFFIFASLPYAAFLLYLAKRYASLPALPAVRLPALPAIKLPTFEAIGEPVLLVLRALKDTPYFKRP